MKQYKQETKHLLDAITSEGYEDCNYYNPCNTEKQKANFSYARFMSEYGWHVEQVGLQKAVIAWLSGLALNIDFYNFDILENYKKWNDIESMTEREADKITENYFNFMSMRLLGLWRKHKSDYQPKI